MTTHPSPSDDAAGGEHLVPVILSGGSGTRLWPYSRQTHPKQFLAFIDQHSLLQQTARRVAGCTLSGVRTAPPVLVCNQAHRFLAAEQLRQAGFERVDMLLEPVGRNTAPALTLAALHTVRDGDPVLATLPSDHLIPDQGAFCAALDEAVHLARHGRVVTFGIPPTGPETGFGYIRRGARVDGTHAVAAFVEKPPLETARAYVESGEYYWNSGIFVLRASLWLELIQRFRPDIAAQCRAAYEVAQRDGQFLRVDSAAFEACPSDSIDYAVMEHLGDPEGPAGAVVVPLTGGWSDLGSWSAVQAAQPQDEHGNVIRGDVYAEDSHDCLLYAENRLLAVLGASGLIVVETPDAVLVAHRDKAQEIRGITDWLQRQGRTEHLHHTRVHRPWGYYESIEQGGRYQVKRLTVNPGAALSLQMHHHRAEHWVVVTGTARITRDDESFLLTENQSTYIPLGVRHRLENPGMIPLELIEVQSGAYLGEDDIVRFQDAYNRVAT